MSFCSKIGVFLKFSKLLLRLDKWAFAIMSMNCKLPGINGRLPTKSNSNKAKEAVGFTRWRREFLLLSIFGGFACLATVLLLLLSCNGRTWRMGPSGEKVFQRHNVSRNEIHNLVSLFFSSDKVTSFHCSKRHGHESPITDGVTCTLKIFGSEKWETKNWNVPVPERLESIDQCSIQDEIFHLHSDRSILNNNALFSAYRSIVSTIFMNYRNHKQVSIQSRSVEANEKEPLYEKWSLFFVKGCCWFLVGIVCSRITSLQPKSPKEVKEHISPGQQRPNLLQPKQQQHASTSPRGAGNWKKRLLILGVPCGVLLSMWIFWSINVDSILSRKETLASMCDERARMLQDQFNVSMNHVHALAILVSTFHHGKTPSAIDQKTFGEYTERTSFERPLTSGVAYALKVSHSERKKFEEEHGWTIKKMESEDQTLGQNCIPENLDPAPIQDEYAPVIFSQETVSHIVSIDMMSGKEDRENILRARASGKGVLTSPFKLLKSNHLGVVLTFAVYNKTLPLDATEEERIGATAGYLGASYDIPSLVEKLLHQLASKQTIVVNVYDTTNASDPISMYGTEDGDRSMLHVSSLDFGDPSRKHEMQCRFKQKPPIPWTAISCSAGCLVIIMLLAQIFRAAINEIAQVEEDCQKMMELKARAEAADVAKSQFLATVSHEIRTPMNGVLGMLQMLMDTDLDATQMDYAQTAHASGRDLISLINEVLDQAKIESGRLELEHVPFDMRFVLDNVLSLFSGKANEKGVELAVYVSRQVPLVVGDPGRFRQIITNLVGNSIKFTREKGHILVSVHLASEVRRSLDFEDEVLKQCSTFVKEDSTESNTLSGFPVVNRWKSWENFNTFNCTVNNAPEKVELLVSVEDTGVGIPLDAQDRIFTPFMQADSSTSRTYGGTGIGLSISKCLVELMQGEIGFVSKPGMGSTFSFTGVFSRVEKEYMDTKLQQYDPAVMELQGLRALVVDCRSLRAEVTRYHLQRLGISVDITSCLESVSSYLSDYSTTSKLRKLDVVLIDKDVWDKEGFVAFHQTLKGQNQSSGSGTPTILPKMFLLATSISPGERNKLISLGFVDNIVAKPLRLSVLVACFQEAFGSGKNRQVNRRKRPNLGHLLREKRILVVDDNMVNRRVAEGALKKYGAVVTCVGSGKAALSMLKPPHKFDACFMDLQMPEMDGFEATRQIRALEKDTNERIASGDILADIFGNVAEWKVPILAMTADVIQATYEECMKCGMDDYVSKPFEEEQLYAAVARFFESA